MFVLGSGLAAAQELELDWTSRLRYDRDAEGSDYDATFFTNITIRDLIKDVLDFKLSGWGRWDIGRHDAFDRALDRKRVRLSEAYFDLRNLGPVSRLRIGRQYLYEVDSLHFDGATLKLLEERPLSFFFFGGRPVSYYESAGGDWLAGGGALWRPSWRTRHQFDLYLLREAGEFFALSGWRWNQVWGEGWRTNSRLRFIGADVRDFRLFATKYFERLSLGLDVDYYLQPRARDFEDELRTRGLSTFGRLFGSRVRNHRLGINLSKSLGLDWMVQFGASARDRIGSDDEDSFTAIASNHAYISVSRFNAWISDLDLTFAFNRIDNENDNLYSFTGEANYRPNDRWAFSLGSSYSRYKIDPIDFPTGLNGQDDLELFLKDIRTLSYFFEVRWRPSKRYDLRAEVAWEDTDVFDRHGLTLRLTVNYHLRRSLARPSDSANLAPAENSLAHKDPS